MRARWTSKWWMMRMVVALFSCGLAPKLVWAQEAATPPRPPEGLIEILFAGGPLGVAIMLVLIGLSLTAAYLVFEHFLSIRRDELLPQDLQDQLAATLQAGRWHEAQAACEQQPGLLAFIISQGLAERDGGWTAVEKALEDALAEQAARLMRRVEYLAVIGNIAPMVGLLGTVTGMILAFRAVARSQGAAGPGELAEGIYQALVTTVVGLIIAIPSLGAFAVMRNRVDQLMAEATYLVQHLCRPLKRLLNVPASQAAPLPPAPPPSSVRRT